MKAERVSSGIPLIIRALNCICSLWFTYTCGDRPLSSLTWQRPVTTCVCKPEAANTVYSFWWWTVCRSKHVEPSINVGIINSITRLHLVGYFNVFTKRCTDPCILNRCTLFRQNGRPPSCLRKCRVTTVKVMRRLGPVSIESVFRMDVMSPRK